ncbi:MAG: DNA replication/repair protein RecF [Pseudomonadota bacterium]
MPAEGPTGPLAGPRLTRLLLTHFRNHASTELTFSAASDAGMVVFTGPNGAGKTNILEAISLMSPGRGLRRARYGDMVMQNGAGAGFSVAAELVPIDFEPDDDPVRIGTGLAAADSPSREVRIDKVPAKSADALLEHLVCLWLTPAMDGLFMGPASDRRRFFDRMVLALHPGHGRAVTRFEQGMRARNKMFDDGVHDQLWFEAVEEPMAKASEEVTRARLATLDLLQKAITEARDAVSAFPHAVLSLDGFSGAETAADYQERLSRGRQRDRAAGRALEGPHRVDLLVRHGPKDVEARLASTGEQKALLIGLILAQARLVKRETSRAAILLLDEIAAHLDEGRRAALFDLCAELGGQTFMTGTDTALFDAIAGPADRFAVDGGKVTRAD